MRKYTSLTAAALVVTLPVVSTSCQNADQQGMAGMLLQVGGGLVGGDAGRIMQAVGTVLVFDATRRQIAQAQATANEALRRASIRDAVRREKVRYVAVPVDRDTEAKGQDKGKSKKVVMLVDADTGKPTGKAYEPPKGSHKSGEEVTVGNTKAVVATGFSGV